MSFLSLGRVHTINIITQNSLYWNVRLHQCRPISPFFFVLSFYVCYGRQSVKYNQSWRKSGPNHFSYSEALALKDKHSWTLIGDQKVKTWVIFLTVRVKVTSKADMLFQVSWKLIKDYMDWAPWNPKLQKIIG